LDKNLNDTPLVTVLMPVYNGERYLREAIDSILNQTYSNFEFLIINDGSTDLSEDIIFSYNDLRIIYVKNEFNIQLIETLNKGLNIAKGEFIARMDADDISYSNRLEKQVHFLMNNQKVGLLGTAFEFINGEERISYYQDDKDLRLSLCFYNSFLHSSVMFRKEILSKYNFSFNKKYIHAEDYKLWTEFVCKSKVANLKDVLVKYRIHDNQISKIHEQVQKEISLTIQKEYFLSAGFSFSNDEFELLQHTNFNKNKVIEYLKFMDKFYIQNKKYSFFDDPTLLSFLGKRYKNYLLEVKKIDKELVGFLSNSLLYSLITLTFKQKISLQLKRFK